MQSKTVTCNSYIEKFSSLASPSPEEMKAYADCINFLYPDITPPELSIPLKIFVILTFVYPIGFALYLRFSRDSYDFVGDFLLGFCHILGVAAAGTLIFLALTILCL